MSDSPALDGGARFTEVMTIRLPPGFLERIRLAARGEAIAPRDFVRRAVSERLLRLEAAKTLPFDQPHATAAASPTGLNTLAAQAGGNPMSGASASTAASTKRRDA